MVRERGSPFAPTAIRSGPRKRARAPRIQKRFRYASERPEEEEGQQDRRRRGLAEGASAASDPQPTAMPGPQRARSSVRPRENPLLGEYRDEDRTPQGEEDVADSIRNRVPNDGGTAVRLLENG